VTTDTLPTPRPRGTVRLTQEKQDPAGGRVRTYRDEIAARIAAGQRFAGLHVAAGGDAVRALLLSPDGTADLVDGPVTDGVAPSVVDIVPAANWDEREARDRFGVTFDGHTPLRPLLDHTGRREWTVPVSGGDVYQVAVGPIHAGIIESGHFRFHVVGDRILQVDARLFYKHRGLEAAAEGRTLEEGLAYAGAACAACSVSNSVAYAQACEHALGLLPDPRLARARTVFLELERLWSHLNDIAAICAGVGMAAGNARFADLTDRARRLNAVLGGHRFLFGTVRIGRSEISAGGGTVARIARELAAIRREVRRSRRELIFNTSFTGRMPGVGTVTAEQALLLGTVGPAARAAGLAEDERLRAPGLAYPSFTAAVPRRADGDVQARFDQRFGELEQTLDLLSDLLDGPLVPAGSHPAAGSRPAGIGVVESPRGRTTCVVERDGDRLARWRLRTGSYANWPSVAFAAADNILPDFPLINKSFELCYACADR
jgi:Ni,Fe-hydrogenase III large subunit